MKNKGTVLSNGYRQMNIGGRKYGVRNYEHRMIMEQFLGRKLLPNEHVHHKNHNKLDNRIENLEVLDKGEHHRMHAIENGLGKDRKGISPVNKTKTKDIEKIISLRKSGKKLHEIVSIMKISYPIIWKYAHGN